MGFKQVFKIIITICVSIAIIYGLRYLGLRAIIGFMVGAVVGAMLMLWYGYGKDNRLTLFIDMIMEGMKK